MSSQQSTTSRWHEAKLLVFTLPLKETASSIPAGKDRKNDRYTRWITDQLCLSFGDYKESQPIIGKRTEQRLKALRTQHKHDKSSLWCNRVGSRCQKVRYSKAEAIPFSDLGHYTKKDWIGL
jgi:hypothetical protein